MSSTPEHDCRKSLCPVKVDIKGILNEKGMILYIMLSIL